MFKELFSNRLFIGALAFFVLCVGGSLLYMHHENQKSAEYAAETQDRVEQWNAKQKEQPTAEAPVVEQPEQVGHFHADGTFHAEPHTPSTHRPDRADVAVSPHGFGPYPPLPPGWRGTPEGTWGNCADPDHELLTRVEIKLLSQGVDVRGGVLDPDTGKVYPSIPGIRYVEWGYTDGGLRYIAGHGGYPGDGVRLWAIADAKFERGEDDILTEADVPADIQLIPYEEAGIDPYEFLGLTRP